MGRMQRDKGQRWERVVARRLREALPGCEDEIKRGWQSRGGRYDPDVVNPFFWVECKHHKHVDIKAALSQAITDCPDDSAMIPIAVTKDDRKAPLVTMRFDDWLDLVGEWYERGQK